MEASWLGCMEREILAANISEASNLISTANFHHKYLGQLSGKHENLLLGNERVCVLGGVSHAAYNQPNS